MNDPIFRRATQEDVAPIVAMLADDELGTPRESPDDLRPYLTAFDMIDNDPHQFLAICEVDGEVVGTMQLTFTHGLSRRGATRATIEAVRIRRDARGSGLGAAMFNWGIQQARERGCGVVQLTTDTARTDSHRFYERLGFRPSHIGFKLML